MSLLTVHLLGPPRVDLNSESVHIGRKKALALLAYLAVTPSRMRRDTLATLLWPDYDQRTARVHLRRALVSLTNRLGREWFVPDRETIILLTSDDLWLDVDQFRQCLAACEAHPHAATDACSDCLALLTEATELYRDDFLAGFSLPDSLPFDEWQRSQTEALRGDLGRVLERLSACHAAQGEYEPAIAAAQRWLDLDPLREAAHRRLMELYGQAGRSAAALRQYRACVRVLEQELDVLPSAETTALYERLRDERLVREKMPAPAPAPTGRTTTLPAFLNNTATPTRMDPPVFVARETELAWLDDCLQATLEGHGKIVFTTGGPGRGKTALMREFTRRAMAAHPDLLAASGNCSAYSGVGDPYLPFRELMAMLTGDVEARWAAGVITREHARRLWNALPSTTRALLDHGRHLIEILVDGSVLLSRAQTLRDTERCSVSLRVPELQEWVDRRRMIAGGPDQSRILQQVADTLFALATEHPLLLTLDDLQWVDSSSSSLLFYLGRRLAETGGRVLILSAYRPEEVALDRDGERNPMRKVLSELRRNFGDASIDLAATDQIRGRAFIDAYLDSQPNRLAEDFRSALSDRTGGHALFTVELLRAMQARGELVRNAEGRWVTGPALDWEALPVRMEAVIQERIERLDEEQRDILATASVEGEVFTAQVVARVQRLPERTVLRALSQELGPKGHRLVSEFEEVTLDRRYATRFRFAHALFQEHLYRCLSSGERRLLHGEVGDALESLYEGHADEIAPALSHHFRTARHLAKAAAYALRAGELAEYACAFAEAIEHCNTALDLHRQLEDRAGEAAVLRTLAGVYFLSGRDDRACQEYGREALRIFRELGDRDGEASSLRLAGFRFIYRTDIAHAESSFQRAVAIHRETGEQRGRAWALCGLARLYHECTNNFERSRACAEEAKRLGRELDDPLLESWADFEYGAALHFEGDYATAGPYLVRGVQVYREYGWLMHMAGCLIHVGLNAIALGDYDAALAHLEQSRSTYRELGMGERGGDPARAEATLALLYHQLGENQAAQDLALRSIDCLKSGYHTCLATALTHSGHASAALGQLDDAAAAYEEALELRRDLDQSHLATEPQAGLARIALAREDHAAALAHVEDILGHLKTGSVNGTNEPLRIYLTCYCVLRANKDPRADHVLAAAHDLLQERAAKIDDDKLRRSYLENVAAHREIAEEYSRTK